MNWLLADADPHELHQSLPGPPRQQGEPSPPQPLPEPPGIPEPVDAPYPGTLRLRVDATDVQRGIFRVHQIIPIAQPGPTVLLYPKWLPGFHAPQAPIELFAGLVLHAGGEPIGWSRHPAVVNGFRFDAPPGVAAIEAEFQYLSPTDASQGRVHCTPDMLFLPWNTVLLYPAGHYARQIEVAASVRLPEDWEHACILEMEEQDGAERRFAPVALDTLIDSPVLAGRYFRRFALDEHVGLSVAADQPHQLDATSDQIAAHRAVVEQADRLFGSRRFDRFEMLLALSDEMDGAGIEHHRCFEAVSVADYFMQWTDNVTHRDTVSHEYLHSWNGKGRRGADSWQPCFERQIRNSLLWVYEGLTQYWTPVLAARSGLWTPAMALGSLAYAAARYDIRPGSRWRPTIDTVRDPEIAARAPLPWPSWQRSEDYYGEGALIWLDVDTRLRADSDGRCTLDDFARAFFGGAAGKWESEPYRFEDVVRTLETLHSFDWKDFFEDALTNTHRHAPLGGLERGGYRLCYRERPNEYQAALDRSQGLVDLTFSLGLVTNNQGKLSDVLWDGPAFTAGLTIGDTITAVGGRQFDPDTLKRAVAEQDHIELTLTKGKRVWRTEIAFDGGLRFPNLEPFEDAPALDAIMRQRP
ncbi:peptidase M61 [Sphingomonas sp.]|jgi:predicted metalloprotease with PDZ domain|uniref:M61 family metallopeptidase n=1 Tax=Sphingomonas sp. TaxID=28214 RepID=UPI002D80EB5A|nr:peptidase M61 [Sphingomonas sp.]HEU0045908.1 peptidase M61 [Sphingomonas sp.]